MQLLLHEILKSNVRNYLLGGGKDLATAAVIGSIKDEKPSDLPEDLLDNTQGALNGRSCIICKTI